MTVRLYADAFRCAIFDEAPGGGDPLDPLSLMNRPAVSPLSWLPNLYFHSDLNYYRIAVLNLSVSINHAAIPGGSTPAGSGANDTPSSAVVQYYGNLLTTNHLLVTHNLGYVPKFFCIYDNKLIPHGTPVQTDTGKARFVTAYATATEIRLYEMGASSDTALAAASRTYQVIVFYDPAADTSSMMLDLLPGQAIFGQGKFKAGSPHLRADGLGDVEWPIATTKSAGVRGGGIRAWYPNGGYVDFAGYNGSLAAPSYLNTSAGV